MGFLVWLFILPLWVFWVVVHFAIVVFFCGCHCGFFCVIVHFTIVDFVIAHFAIVDFVIVHFAIVDFAISACEKGQQWQRALALLEDMQGRCLEPNVISLSAAISACEKGPPWHGRMVGG